MKKQLPFIDVQDKAVAVYSQFTPEEFWQYVNPKSDFIYELRMKSPREGESTQPYIEEIGERLRLPYHWTGVFVQTWQEFFQVATYAYQQKLTLYLSANPKRPSIHSKDSNRRPQYNGMKQSELCIAYLLFDFDATLELKNTKEFVSEEVTYRVAKKFLAEHPNIRNYCLICSGNGTQIRIRLDRPIYLPKDTYDEEYQFIETEEVATFSKLCKFAMKPVLAPYGTPHVYMDPTSLELARVGRAPFSANQKDPTKPKFAGVIEIVDEGENEGLYDHIMSHYEQVRRGEEKLREYAGDERLAKEFTYDEMTIRGSPLVHLLLDNGELPAGGRNNVLFFQFKLLCRANRLSIKHPHIQALIRDMRRVQHHSFIDNEPPATMKFHPEAIINWCIENQIKPLWDPLYYRPTAKRKILPEELVMPKVPGALSLVDGQHFTNRLQLTLAQRPIQWQEAYSRRKSLTNLLGSILATYGEAFTEYVIRTGVLLTILKKV